MVTSVFNCKIHTVYFYSTLTTHIIKKNFLFFNNRNIRHNFSKKEHIYIFSECLILLSKIMIWKISHNAIVYCSYKYLVIPNWNTKRKMNKRFYKSILSGSSINFWNAINHWAPTAPSTTLWSQLSVNWRISDTFIL